MFRAQVGNSNPTKYRTGEFRSEDAKDEDNLPEIVMRGDKRLNMWDRRQEHRRQGRRQRDLLRSLGWNTFDDDDARSFVLPVDVGGHAAVVARILYFAVGDFAGDHAVRHGHCVVVLGQLSLVLEPFDLNHTTSTVFSLRTIQLFIFDLLLKIEEDKKIKMSKVLTVGVGLPLRQQRSLHVCCNWMTRGRNIKVKVGADSFSSCQIWTSRRSRRRTGVESGMNCGISFGTAVRINKTL